MLLNGMEIVMPSSNYINGMIVTILVCRLLMPTIYSNQEMVV